jgi:hypothetical protein
MSIVRKLKEHITTTSQRALGLDGIRFNLEVALERVLALCSQLEGMSAQMDEMALRIETMSTQNNRPVLNDALRRLQTHEIEVASLIDVGASDGKWSKNFARYFPGRRHLLVERE